MSDITGKLWTQKNDVSKVCKTAAGSFKKSFAESWSKYGGFHQVSRNGCPGICDSDAPG